ncbi:hypothetical protein EPR50_G00033480 [Perca flavescens]|uniref:Ig-like domain-containing protein n=1 Tax=Perca flavescens TaxID=8167 RepID=A0A484DG40_PERFV|nr:hypothetical protein EPR50_G00033480 [Perca flavescens]
MNVEGGSDVVLPCSLSTKENIEFKRFYWTKVAQKDENLKEVFMYDAGIPYNYGRKEVSHFEDELKHGNASIIIRNTKISDNGTYTCHFPRLQPPQIFNIELAVGTASKPSVTTLDQQDWVLQCEVHGNPKPKVEWQDSDGKNLNATVTQVSEREGSFYITLQTAVTKTNTYRCVATQEGIKHQIYAETSVHISGPKLIKVEEGSDVTLPCSLWPKEDITSTRFVWKKTDDGQKVFQYDKGVLYSDKRPDQSEQFKGRVSHFEDKLEQGNASITIRNTTRADSGEYRCSFPFIQKPQLFHIKLDVVGPEVIKVEEGSDVTLPCYLWAKGIRSTQFNWKKMSQNEESQMDVFLYNKGERPDQSEQFKGPKVIKVQEGSDVTLPCSLTTKEDIRLTQFIWQKVSQKTGNGQKVFLYDNGDLYSDERPGLTVITVEGGSDVTLPCFLWPKEDIRSTRFMWQKVSQKADDGQMVFLYDNGDVYSDERPDQSEQFKEPKLITVEEGSDVTLPCSLITKKDLRLTRFVWRKTDDDQMVFLYDKGLTVLKVEEGSDVTLPCSLITKEDIRSTRFNWKKMSQNDESQMEVFLYNKDELPGQSEQFKGRVSHFPDELEQGNASITITDTTKADSGVYRCIVPLIQKPQIFYIKLDVVGEYFDEPVKDVLSFKDWSLVSTLLSSCCI